MGWVIRAMKSADVRRMVEIAASLEQAPHWPVAHYIRMLDDGTPPRRTALVACEPGEGGVAGFAIAVLMPPEAELESICVSAEWQRQGIAGTLWNELKRELAAAGVTTVHLEVRAGNLPARGFYRRLGFAESGKRRGYYVDPPDDAVLYRIELV